MNTIPFTNRQSIVKVCVVGILGLAVLVGSSTVTLAARKKLAGNNVTCHCYCDTGTNGGIHYGGVLSWVRKSYESCNLLGRGCDKDGREGTVTECSECIPNPKGGRVLCQEIERVGFLPGGGVIKPPAEQSDPVIKPPLPYQKPATGGGVIRYRGVEGEPATSAPTEQKDTTPAPK